MSFIKRLANVGKGLWTVQTKARDPQETARIRALQAEIEADQAAGRSAGRSSSRQAGLGPQATDPVHAQDRLDALADQLRQGSLDRATYDAACARVIASLEGAEAPVATAPAAKPTAEQPAERPPSGPVKRTL